MLRRKKVLTILLFILILTQLWPQAEVSPFSIKLLPGGSFLLTGNETVPVKAGGGVATGFAVCLTDWGLYVDGGLGFDLTPISDNLSVSILTAGAGGGIKLALNPQLKLFAGAQGGYFYGILSDGETGRNPAARVYGGMEYGLTPQFSLGLDLSYRYLHAFYSGLQAALSINYNFRKKAAPEPSRIQPQLLDVKVESEIQAVKKGNGLGLSGLVLYDVFPVFFKYYEDNPIGKAILHNWENREVTDIRVSFFVKNLMDYPRVMETPVSLKPGEEAVINLYSLFSSKILELSESTKVSASINLSYLLKNNPKSEEIIETIRIYDRNAVTWDDDRKAAAFITAKDSSVLKFSKNVASLVQESSVSVLNRNLLLSMGIFETLSYYGITYVIDPTTPYKNFSQDAQAVDYLQFPIQTLEYKAGDCDDLSILYSALLEAVGIDTALITIPGHIFMAFALNVPQEEVEKSYFEKTDFIFSHGNTWVPVEVTLLDRGFLLAWHEAAKQWREYAKAQGSGFYPVKEAWKVYEPVGFNLSSEVVVLPEKEKIIATFTARMQEFISREIYTRESELLAKLKQKENDSVRNQLGVLYARYGRTSQAKKEFSTIIKSGQYVPALVNLGNIYFLENQLAQALEYYKKALKLQPENPKILLPVARINYQLEKYQESQEVFARLKEVDSGLAAGYSYLEFKREGEFRAADLSQLKGEVLWVEE